MKRIFALEEYLVKAEKTLIVAFIFLMIALSFLQVILRLCFQSGIVWLDPLLRHMVLWSGLLGTALASRYNRQFALEALVKFAPEKFHRPLAIAAGIFTAAVSSALLFAAYKFIKDEFAADSTAFYINDLAIKGGWAEIIIPAVFVLIILHTLLNLFREAEPEEFKL